MTRVALVEDEQGVRQELADYLARYTEETRERFAVRSFRDGRDIVDGYTPAYDVIFMDIQMKNMDGMTAAERIRKVDPAVCIIFTTNLASYAVRGYAVSAVGYLLKPITYYAFSQSLQRALETIRRRTGHFLCIPGKSGMRRMDITKIWFIEVSGRDLVYHTAEGDIPATGRLKDVESSLQEESFFRCNKGYLLNLEHVDGMVQDDAMVHGFRVQISRSKKKAFLEALNRYSIEVEP